MVHIYYQVHTYQAGHNPPNLLFFSAIRFILIKEPNVIHFWS